ALAAALAEMVAKITLDKKRFAEKGDRVKEIAAIMEVNRSHMLNYMDRDSESYQKVLDAYELPKHTEEEILVRSGKINEALKLATVVQLNVAKRGYNLLSLIDEITNLVKGGIQADGKVSMMICRTAIFGAILNVKNNLAIIKDKSFVENVQSICSNIELELENNFIVKC
ncbi:MAG TPA: cyclodeaminase/cyclohydrolase family protein, partial [Fermentimonas sp.]|nr:cyclodeaminase/cyclohydrolase family protein [Fermentimonas sp.]